MKYEQAIAWIQSLAQSNPYYKEQGFESKVPGLTKAQLQKAIDDGIITPYAMREWNSGKGVSVTTYYKVSK